MVVTDRQIANKYHEGRVTRPCRLLEGKQIRLLLVFGMLIAGSV